MKRIGLCDFPETSEETTEWQETVRVVALSSRVLAVAVTGAEGAWRAYCDAVPGIRHDHEWGNVLTNGDKLSQEIAAAIFPDFADVPYAR